MKRRHSEKRTRRPHLEGNMVSPDFAPAQVPVHERVDEGLDIVVVRVAELLQRVAAGVAIGNGWKLV